FTIADRSNCSLTRFRMKCAKCPFATKSNADGGNIMFCSGLQSRNVFAMSPMQLHTLVTNGPRPHYLDRLCEGESRRRRQGVAHTPSGMATLCRRSTVPRALLECAKGARLAT